MFCAIGTPVLAAESGRIVDVGDSIGPATGRFVTIDLDDGRRVRYLHLSRRVVSVGDRVRRGQVIGYSGATGYGEEDWSWNVAETGGAHVHMTLWLSQRYIFGSNGSVDPEPYFDADGSPAGDISEPFEEDDMYDDAAKTKATERHDEIIRALEKIHRAAAPFKVVAWGTGLVVYNPLNRKVWVLPEGYEDLLQMLGLVGGNPVPVDTNQLGFATGFIPAALGELGDGGDGFTSADLDEIKKAIAESQVAVTPDQLKKLTDAVGAAARTGGEQGAVKALKDLTFVVSTA